MTRVQCHIALRLYMNSLGNAQHTTGSRVTGTPTRKTLHQGTPHLHHLLNSTGGWKSKASVSTLMVGTSQVLGTYDMKG
jgi:hypothetical protein